jgi:hypothetical protein
MIAVYMPAAYGAAWQYCSYIRINLPLLKITFCFHTASAVLGHFNYTLSFMLDIIYRRCLVFYPCLVF